MPFQAQFEENVLMKSDAGIIPQRKVTGMIYRASNGSLRKELQINLLSQNISRNIVLIYNSETHSILVIDPDSMTVVFNRNIQGNCDDFFQNLGKVFIENSENELYKCSNVFEQEHVKRNQILQANTQCLGERQIEGHICRGYFTQTDHQMNQIRNSFIEEWYCDELKENLFEKIINGCEEITRNIFNIQYREPEDKIFNPSPEYKYNPYGLTEENLTLISPKKDRNLHLGTMGFPQGDKIGTQEKIILLKVALKWAVSASATKGVLSLGEKATKLIPLLVELLNDEHPVVRSEASKVLEKLRS